VKSITAGTFDTTFERIVLTRDKAKAGVRLARVQDREEAGRRGRTHAPPPPPTKSPAKNVSRFQLISRKTFSGLDAAA
jgi:hypothetical protein